MKRWLLGLCCLMLSGVVLAAGAISKNQSAPLSMEVTGTIEVTSDGNVTQYTLDHQEKLPQGVTALLAKMIPAWKFGPVQMDGKPVTLKAPMSLRVVASPVGTDQYELQIEDAVFGSHMGEGKDSANEGEALIWRHEVAPVYPHEAVEEAVSGTVYVLAQVDRQGKVAQAVARQVDLSSIPHFTSREVQLDVWRHMLAHAALDAAKHWTFNPPTRGESAADPYWTVFIPVTFTLRGFPTPSNSAVAYGKWQLYLPGPVQDAPWEDKEMLAGSSDAVPDDGKVFQANKKLHLLTKAGGG